MKRILVRTENLFTEKLEYYLTVTYSEDYPGVEMYGVSIINANCCESCVTVDGVDYQKDRMLEFINSLADGLVAAENLRELCEDYVDMLEFRGISK